MSGLDEEGLGVRGECSRCRCTDDNACVCGPGEGEPCFWGNAGHTLCSACLTPAEAAALVPEDYMPEPMSEPRPALYIPFGSGSKESRS